MRSNLLGQWFKAVVGNRTQGPQRRGPQTWFMSRKKNTQTINSKQSDSDSSFYREAQSTFISASRPRGSQGRVHPRRMPAYATRKGMRPRETNLYRNQWMTEIVTYMRKSALGVKTWPLWLLSGCIHSPPLPKTVKARGMWAPFQEISPRANIPPYPLPTYTLGKVHEIHRFLNWYWCVSTTSDMTYRPC